MRELKNKVLQLLGGLVMEKKDDKWIVSMGRVSWWMVFIPAIVIWMSSGAALDDKDPMKDISPNHLSVIVMMAGYNFGKKVVDSVGTAIKDRAR